MNFSKILRGTSVVAFAVIAGVLIIMLFPVVLCPMMWMFFLLAIVAQFPWSGPGFVLGRLYTVAVFLLVAFRIHYGFVTDFTISTPETLAVKFLIVAILYGAGNMFALSTSPRVAKFLIPVAFLFLIGTGITSYLLVKETYYEACQRFQTSNPDCIALDNWTSREYQDSIQVYYNLFNRGKENKQGMVYKDTKVFNGKYYSFLISNGSAKNTPPLFSIEETGTDSIVIAKIMFRYNPDFHYGFLRYEILLPNDSIIHDKERAMKFFTTQLKIIRMTSQ